MKTDYDCAVCNAEVLVVPTVDNSLIILNREPDSTGNISLTEDGIAFIGFDAEYETYQRHTCIFERTNDG